MTEFTITQDYLIDKILETVEEAKTNNYPYFTLQMDLRRLIKEYEDQLYGDWDVKTVDDLVDKIETLELDLEDKEEELDEVSEELDNAKERITELETELEEAREQIAELGGSI